MIYSKLYFENFNFLCYWRYDVTKSGHMGIFSVGSRPKFDSYPPRNNLKKFHAFIKICTISPNINHIWPHYDECEVLHKYLAIIIHSSLTKVPVRGIYLATNSSNVPLFFFFRTLKYVLRAFVLHKRKSSIVNGMKLVVLSSIITKREN